ncbi:Membrane component of multidrug resistance system [Bacillus cereus]|nr:Membrane component of multidrug resistance system [Bacillus cereus]
MSSIVIAGYALFCIIVFFLVNRLLRKKKRKWEKNKSQP